MKTYFSIPLSRQYAACLFAIFAISGCATSSAPKPEETLRASVNLLAQAVQQNDIDGIMALLSPMFHHPDIGDRNDAYTTMLLAMEGRSGGSFMLDLSSAEYMFDKDTGRAEVGPIVVRGNQTAYQISVSLTQVPDSDAWQVLTFRMLD